MLRLRRLSAVPAVPSHLTKTPKHQHNYSDNTVGEGGPAISCWCGGAEISTGSYCDYGKQRGVLLFFSLASGAWGIAVLRSVLTAAVSGSVASWWFSSRGEEERWFSRSWLARVS